jgi:hypothetical protein
MAGDYPVTLLPIQAELTEVFARLKACLNPDGGMLLNSYWPRFGVDQVVPAAFVIFSARLYENPGGAVLPALLLTLIHLAFTFHDIPAQIQGRDRQLVILEGDYIYAHLLYQLYKNECLFLLERLSRLIREMNEGSVMRWLLEQGIQEQEAPGAAMAEALTRRYGRFFAECGALGGYFAGRRGTETAMLGQLGMSFGIAYGVKESGGNPELQQNALERALKLLQEMPGAAHRDEIEQFIREAITSPSSRFEVRDSTFERKG